MITLSALEAKQYRITAAGMLELQQQLEDLREQRRRATGQMSEVASQTATDAAPEDSTYIYNQDQTVEIDRQIVLLERIISMAEVIRRPQTNDTVQLGSRVAVAVDGKEQTYTIVGPIEADPSEGKVSDESPVGRALLGKKAGDHLEVALPAKRSAVTIRHIG